MMMIRTRIMSVLYFNVRIFLLIVNEVFSGFKVVDDVLLSKFKFIHLIDKNKEVYVFIGFELRENNSQNQLMYFLLFCQNMNEKVKGENNYYNIY
jgi:phage pi2 protein 07